MAEDTDGVGEAFDDQLRIALTIASQFGERIARLREQLARQREAAATQQTRELEARFEAERGAARASLAPVQQPEWWNQATPEDIAGAHETATVWRDYDDVANSAETRIRDEVRERYGIDVDAPGADPVAVAAALQGAEHDRDQARAQRERAGEELTASQLLLADVNRRDARANELDQDNTDADRTNDPESQRQAEQLHREAEVTRGTSGLDYDSSERRRQFASSLEGKADQKTIDARILADGDQAKHPREAVRSQPGRAPKARRASTSTVQQRERGGLSRGSQR
ncbi:hypothetical protein [Cryobacterium sp. M91]|uniref:hypothetical protein n=1 Tax=Cryobacterium sp. M91 TaxID=2048294 RepID=UPI000CE2E9C0|nr:hypothetical protein [Cryobacterium sp. M91]